MSLRKIKQNICSNCKSDQLITNNRSGYVICKSCGCVDKEVINVSQEWRYYGSEDNKSTDPTRCGRPIDPLLPKSSMATTIGGSGFHNIKRLHNWTSMPYNERSLYNIFEKIKLKTQHSNIPKIIIDDAMFIYKIIHDKTEKNEDAHILTRGSIRKGVIAACIYNSCKKHNMPRSPVEIAKIFDIDNKTMTRGCKKFKEIMKSKNIVLNIEKPKINDFIIRYCSKLKFEKHLIHVALFVYNKVKKLSIASNNTPLSIIGGIICLMTNLYALNVKKSDISKICNVSEVTITKCYKKLNKYVQHVLPRREKVKLNL